MIPATCRSFPVSVVMIVMLVFLSGCGRKETIAEADSKIVNTWKKVDVPPGADPSVPDSLGGNGFEKIADSLGYTTYIVKPEEQGFFGDPRAKVGGMITFPISRFMITFRPFFFGPNSNFTENSTMTSMCYQSLISLHPTNLEYVPLLATHWKISEDLMTFWFRIDPNARWWDGKRVTAQDVVSTWKLVMDPTILSPSMQQTYDKYEEPVAVSPYIVTVKAKEKNWRSFMSFGASLPILQHDEIGGLTGKEFIDKFVFQQPVGSGEYIILPQDIKKEESYMFTRRDDYWRKDYSTERYSGNFDKIKFIAIADNPTVEYETYRRGEADLFYYTSISIENWVSDTKEEPFQKNWIKKVRVKTDGAAGAYGVFFNMRKPPFNDVRIRKAFYYLFDRKSIIDQLLYDEYEPYNSFYAGGMYENENNVKYSYDPQKARDLLESAGWKERNSNGILVKNGMPFTIEMTIQKPVEKFLTLYQQTLRRAGIDLKLKFEDGNAITKRIAEREFSLTWANYGGLTFPNPETSYASFLAPLKDNNNITGFADKYVDELLEKYKVTITQSERIAIIKEIDGILSNTVIAALAWNTKGIKLGYWDKFGMPEYVLYRTTQAGDHDLAIMSSWWYDPEKAAALELARKNGTALPGEGKIMEKRYWKEHKF